MSGDIPPLNNNPLVPPGATSGNALDLGEAVVVSMPKEVLDASTKSGKAGRILAEVVAQQGQHATLKTADGAFIIKTNAPLNVGQVVMLKLDPAQLEAQVARTLPIIDDVAITDPISQYQVRLAPQVANVDKAAEPLPQTYWRGQLAPVHLPDDPTEIIHVLEDIYKPGVPLAPGQPAPSTALPPSIGEGIAKFFALTQLLREMGSLPPSVNPNFLFADMPPDDASALIPQTSKLQQSLQGLNQKLQEAVLPGAQKATEQAGQWLKAKLPSNLLNQLDQFKDVIQKNLGTEGLLPTAQPGMTSLPTMSFAFPPGSSLLQIWQNAMQGTGSNTAPFLLLNMLGLQRPGQGEMGLSQLMPQFKALQDKNGAIPVMPTLVLPGAASYNPVLLSPYGLMFSQTSHALGGTSPLLPGTVIFWSPVANPQPLNIAGPMASLPLWPAAKSMPLSVFEWPDLNAMFRDKAVDPGLSQTWQSLIQNMIPNMAHPDKMPGAVLLLLQALNRGNVSGWIGDKTVNTLRDEGKQDIIARLVSDFATSAGRVIDPLQPDTQRFVLPMVLHEQMAKMVWQVKRDYPDGHNNENDPQERKKNTRTHFTIDVPTATLGDLHMQGVVWKQQLDLNLKTAHPLNETMQNGIRERFQTALAITGMNGQILFNTND